MIFPLLQLLMSPYLKFLDSSLWATDLYFCFSILYLDFIYLFWAALCLCRCMQAFSVCSVQASHHGGFSCYGEQALGSAGSVVVAHRHEESSRTRDRTCAPYTGRQILNHWTTREVYLILSITPF